MSREHLSVAIHDLNESSFAKHFISPEGCYLLSHSVGPISKPALDTNEQFVQQWKTLGGNAWPLWLDSIEAFRKEIGDLLNTNPRNVCPQPTVTSGLTQWLTALRKLSKTPKLHVVMHEEAFPSLGYAVKGLQSQGIELVIVKGNVNDVTTWESAFEDDYAAIAIFTHVHSNTGAVCNIDKLSRLAKHYGLFVGVDIAQSAGIVPIDVAKWHIDAAFGSCVKWLSGGTGAGFMIVLDQPDSLIPDHLGWFSHKDPFAFDIHEFVPADDALRFWGGTPSPQPYFIAASSIGTIRKLGVDNLYNHTKHLQGVFVDAARLNFEAELDSIGGTLCLPFETTQIDNLKELITQHSIQLDVRNNRLRISFHAIHNINTVLWLSDTFTSGDFLI